MVILEQGLRLNQVLPFFSARSHYRLQVRKSGVCVCVYSSNSDYIQGCASKKIERRYREFLTSWLALCMTAFLYSWLGESHWIWAWGNCLELITLVKLGLLNWSNQVLIVTPSWCFTRNDITFLFVDAQ